MKILINTPDISQPGGVANHYKGLKPFWTECVTYNFIGGRKGIPGPLFLIYDYIKFIFLCAFGNYDVILLNPSLGKTALKRDALFLKISKWFKIKTIVFFHGWGTDLANEISKRPDKFIKQYNKADSFLVLASSFKAQLKSWGITKTIHLTTTKIDNNLIRYFEVDKKKFNNTILFLARVEKNKGIFIALETMKLLNQTHPHLNLIVAGDGGALQSVKNFVEEKEILNVEFLGSISGQLLIDAFSKSDIYILPTWHGEGMPTSVLEAMAFGLPIISRPVGGLVDFFEEDKMGYLLETLEPKDYAHKIIELLENCEKRKNIGQFNSNYATTHFMASIVAIKLQDIFSQ